MTAKDLMPVAIPHDDDGDRCDICCRPRDQHIGSSLECDAVTYFRPMPRATPPAAPAKDDLTAVIQKQLPCPFCGSEDVLSLKSEDKVHPYRMVCQSCGCSTAHHGDFRKCYAAWQTRITREADLSASLEQQNAVICRQQQVMLECQASLNDSRREVADLSRKLGEALEEAVCYLDELIEHTGDDMIDSRGRRADEIRATLTLIREGRAS